MLNLRAINWLRLHSTRWTKQSFSTSGEHSGVLHLSHRKLVNEVCCAMVESQEMCKWEEDTGVLSSTQLITSTSLTVATSNLHMCWGLSYLSVLFPPLALCWDQKVRIRLNRKCDRIEFTSKEQRASHSIPGAAAFTTRLQKNGSLHHYIPCLRSGSPPAELGRLCGLGFPWTPAILSLLWHTDSAFWS